MKKLLTLFLVLCLTSVNLSAQEFKPENQQVQDSVLYTTTLYFESGNSEWIETYEYFNVGRLLRWAQNNPKTLIDVKGWSADNENDYEPPRTSLAYRRAKAIRSYLVQKGIDPSRITFESKGIDYEADSIKARRADVVGYVRVATKEVVAKTETEKKTEKKTEKVTETELRTTETQQDPVRPSNSQQDPAILSNSQQEQQSTPKPKTKPEEIATEPTKQPEPTQTTQLAPQPKRELTYYAGAGLGTSFGRSTFASFAADGTKVGLNTNIFAGAEFSKLLSAELSIGYTAMSLGMYDCCEGLYYVDGERYFAPVAGATSYAYHDLTAKTNLVSISAKANFNIIALFNKDSKWQALISPKVGVGFSSAKLNYDNSTIAKESNTHLIVGGALGAIFSIDERWGVRLTSGVDYLTGGAFDALPQCEHSNGYIWNTELSVIYKF